jgi:regulator of sigma E protease
MTLLTIDWAVVGIKTLQFILAFGILVILHELGHFATARWFKCRVEKFYLFFDAGFSLWKKKIGDTIYGIGWVPIGGYVKISGMVDESMDKEQMKLPPKPYEFRSKPAWQRLIIMVAGVIMNVLLSFVIYAMMLWHWGEEYVPTNKMTYGIVADSLAQTIGLRDGDKILNVDGKYIDKFKKIPLKIILGNAKTIEINRNGKDSTINIPSDFATNIMHTKDLGFIDLRMPFAGIDSVVADTSTAFKAGLKKGDKIIAANGENTFFMQDFRNVLQKNIGKQIALSVVRGNDTTQINVKVPVDGTLGIYNIDPKKIFDVKEISYGFFESFPAGIKRSGETLRSYWLQLRLIFSGKVKTSESLGGIVSIGNAFPSSWDWQSFWSLTAFFSIVLAFMNILPIPALDGGHALFCVYEIITGKKPSDKFMEYAQMVGMVLLLGLMAYALGLDFWRIFKK